MAHDARRSFAALLSVLALAACDGRNPVQPVPPATTPVVVDPPPPTPAPSAAPTPPQTAKLTRQGPVALTCAWGQAEFWLA